MPRPVEAVDFRAAMASFAASVTVVTTLDESGTPFGLTATAFSSVCPEPPTCLVCVAKDAEAEPVIARTRRFAVNVLCRAREELSTRFATSGADKFGSTPWRAGPALGLPVLEGSLATMECEVQRTETVGDHSVFFGVLQSVATDDGEPLLYFRGSYRALSSG